MNNNTSIKERMEEAYDLISSVTYDLKVINCGELARPMNSLAGKISEMQQEIAAVEEELGSYINTFRGRRQ